MITKKIIITIKKENTNIQLSNVGRMETITRLLEATIYLVSKHIESEAQKTTVPPKAAPGGDAVMFIQK